MRWVTRRRIHVNRTATAWLVTRASFLYGSLYAHLKGQEAGKDPPTRAR